MTAFNPTAPDQAELITDFGLEAFLSDCAPKCSCCGTRYFVGQMEETLSDSFDETVLEADGYLVCFECLGDHWEDSRYVGNNPARAA